MLEYSPPPGGDGSSLWYYVALARDAAENVSD